MDLKIKRLDKGLPLPAYKTPGSVALDLYARESIIMGKFTTSKIPTGIAIEIPLGYEGQIRPRSSTSADGIIVHPGTIDADYRGELMVIVSNFCSTLLRIERGDRIAQLVIAPVTIVNVLEAEELSVTHRGVNGFGSTGLRL